MEGGLVRVKNGMSSYSVQHLYNIIKQIGHIYQDDIACGWLCVKKGMNGNTIQHLYSIIK